jgi:dTDP-4-dehydrorhamnose reductase
MRVLVVGAKGMLGADLVSEVDKRGHEPVPVDLDELDITSPTAVAEIAAGRFGDLDWCFNCAAYTAVDKAESERDLAMMVNGIAPGYLAQACSMKGIRLLHVSTDFVFDGTAETPYREDSRTHPLGAYGASKLAGEDAVLPHGAVVVRTSWLYGPHGESFPKTMIRAWMAGKALRVVADQKGTPTYTGDLSRVMVDLAQCSPDGGVYHAAGPTVVTWHELACNAICTYQEVMLSDIETAEIQPIATADWPTPAQRPMYSALCCDKLYGLGIAPMQPLNDALTEFVQRVPL